jgi:hypothetical protein
VADGIHPDLNAEGVPVFLFTRSIRIAGLAAGIALLGAGLTVPSAGAEPESMPPPPPIEHVLFFDPLIDPGTVRSGSCPTGHASGVFVGEGYELRVAGRCRDTDPRAKLFGARILDIGVPDGEVRLEMKAVRGAERVSLSLFARAAIGTEDSRVYETLVVPTRGYIALWADSDSGEDRLLTERDDLHDRFDPEAWNAVAIRAQGPQLWVLLNDEPVLYVEHAEPLAGGVALFGIMRQGDPDDDAESAVVLRNLRISTLRTGGDAAAPQSSEAEQSAHLPNVGETLITDPLVEPGLFRPFDCPTGRGSGAFTDGGYRLKANGGCFEHSTAAEASWRVPGVQFSDGEVNVEFRFQGDRDRTTMSLMLRDETGETPFRFYDVQVEPGSGSRIVLTRFGPEEEEHPNLAVRPIADLLRENDWNRLAVRAEGAIMWVLLNDRVVLIVRDEHYTRGSVRLSVLRSGPVEDDIESSVVLRNLQISRLAP